jgi:hypothetical protein
MKLADAGIHPTVQPCETEIAIASLPGRKALDRHWRGRGQVQRVDRVACEPSFDR